MRKAVASIGLFTAICLAWSASFSQAAPVPAGGLSEEQLKERVQQINKDATNLEAADAKLKELVKDKKTAAALVTMAAKMMRDADEGKRAFRFYPALVFGKAAENVKDYESAELFYNFCTDNAINELQSGRLIVTAVENQLEFLWARKRYKDVEELCDKFLVLEGDRNLNNAKIFVMERQIQAMAKQGDIDKALDRADRMIKLFDNGWYFIQMRGWIEREAEKYDAAIKTYLEVIESLENNGDLDPDARARFLRNTKYVLSGVYLEADKLDKSTELLQELIKSDPENPTYYNDLGFLWCDHDMKLEESEKLIRKAIEMDLAQRQKLADEGKIDASEAKKPNSAYADSLGWVLYKRGKYEEALPHLQQAAKDEDDGGHIEIWDHLGDCLLALGKKQEALDTFQKALKMEDISKKDAERRKKVQEKIKKLKAELQ